MSELPEGWKLTSLAETCYLQYGKNLPTIKLTNEGYPVFGANGQIGFYSTYHYEEPRVLITCRGATCGTINRSLPKSFVTNNSIMIEPISQKLLHRRFLEYQLSSIDKGSVITGSAQPQITLNNLEPLTICLAPLNEQRRIVAKLGKLLSRVDAVQARLATIARIIKRFRQSVLAAACSGHLTADWRDENPKVQHAGRLLSEVKTQRTARHTSDCASAKSRGQKAPKLKWADENPNFSGYDLPDLPDSWVWSHVSRFGFVRGGKRLPKGELLVEKNTGHPYLRIRDLKYGTVDGSQILYVPRDVFPAIHNYTIKHGDVYLTIVGSIGEAGTIPPELDGASLTENAAKIVQPIGLTPDYLVSWFRSPVCQQIIQQNIHSGGQGKLALFRIEELPVPLAPLAEQREIVRRVEALFRTADALEARYRTAKRHVDKLTQSILAKAFRGELVPTEAELARQEGRDYEPASVLLQHIREESATRQTSERSARSPRRKQARAYAR